MERAPSRRWSRTRGARARAPRPRTRAGGGRTRGRRGIRRCAEDAGGMPPRSGSVGLRAARARAGRVPPAGGRVKRASASSFRNLPSPLPRAGRALAGAARRDPRAPIPRPPIPPPPIPPPPRGRAGARAGASRCACASPRARGENRKPPRSTRGRAARAKRSLGVHRGLARGRGVRRNPATARPPAAASSARRARGRRVTRRGPPKRFFPGSFVPRILATGMNDKHPCVREKHPRVWCLPGGEDSFATRQMLPWRQPSRIATGGGCLRAASRRQGP